MLHQYERFMSESQRRFFAEGKAEGEAKGEAMAILRVLARRGLMVTEDQRARIVACKELSILESWLDAAVTASSTEEIF